MSKWQFLALGLLISSCGQGRNEQAGGLEEQPQLLIAAQSVSLEFPLHFDPDDNPPGYIKVATANLRNDTQEHLIDALVLCSSDLSWIEKTSHTMAIIMPSEDNAIWKGYEGWHPSVEEIIACIKQSAKQPFFYRNVPKGTKKYGQI